MIFIFILWCYTKNRGLLRHVLHHWAHQCKTSKMEKLAFLGSAGLAEGSRECNNALTMAKSFHAWKRYKGYRRQLMQKLKTSAVIAGRCDRFQLVRCFNAWSKMNMLRSSKTRNTLQNVARRWKNSVAGGHLRTCFYEWVQFTRHNERCGRQLYRMGLVLDKHCRFNKREAFLALRNNSESERLRHTHLDRSDALIFGFGEQCNR